MTHSVARRPAILDAIGTSGHAVIEASAGTGKTFTLEHLVVDAVLRERVPLDALLVVTFTEKAAGELKQRLRRKLGGLLDGAVAPSPESDAGPEAEAWVLDAEARVRLEAALHGFDRATIATIHAFCQRVLVEQAFAQGRPFRQALVDGRAALERAFLSVLRTEIAREPEPRAWLDAWLDGHRLDDLLGLVQACVERGGRISPRFDPGRLQRALVELGRAPTAWRAVRPLLVRGGVRGGALVEAEGLLAELVDLLEQGEALRAPGVLRRLEAEPELVGRLLALLGPVAERQPPLGHLVGALRLLEEAQAPFAAAFLQIVLPRVRARLDDDKARRGELDFSDMLHLLDASLHGPGGDALVEILRARYPVALIDEFQDTDEVQWRIFRRLYLDPGASGRLVVIGDPKQAIYGFRGADLDTYLAARAALFGAGGRSVALTQSFRSTPALVAALDALFDPAARPPFFSGPVEHPERMRAGRSDSAALLEAGRPGPPVVVLQPAPEEALSGVRGAERALASLVADEITRLVEGDGVQFRPPLGEPRPLAAREIFVLTRSAREGRIIGQALAARGVPAAFYKQEGLFQSAEAHHLRALLAAIADPHRPALALRAWRTPFFGVPLERLERCRDLRPSDPLLARLLEWKALADRRDYARLFGSIVDDSRVAERLLFSPEGDRAHTNYLHLIEILQAEADEGRPPLGELVHRLSAFMANRARPTGEDGNVERLESDRDAVQIMTMHKSKGLEAEVVFLFGGLVDVPALVHPFHEGGSRALHLGRTPPEAARAEGEAEARRLLYVALTRARTRVYVPYLGGPEADEPLQGLGGLQAVLEPHLARLLGQGAEGWSLRRIGPGAVEDRVAPPSSLAWAPEPALLVRPTPDPGFQALRAARWGPVVTSYSRMKEELAGASTEGSTPSSSPAGGASIETVTEPDALPPGAATGRFLHEVLELADLDAALAAPDASAWLALPETRALLRAALLRHGRSAEHLESGGRLVHRGLVEPLPLGPGVVLERGVAGADRVLREMEFLFPIPAEPSSGFVKGYVDVVLEHAGRTYVLDWKSDVLPSAEPADVDAYVRASYLLQAEIYAVATSRLIGAMTEPAYEALFGGVVYVFLRALGPGRGTWTYRPSWRELLAASARLEARPGLARPGREDAPGGGEP